MNKKQINSIKFDESILLYFFTLFSLPKYIDFSEEFIDFVHFNYIFGIILTDQKIGLLTYILNMALDALMLVFEK